MKTSFKILTLISLVLAASTFRLRKEEITPQGEDLSNHFGTRPEDNVYGVHNAAPVVNLIRQGVTGPEVPITPITNFNKEIKPEEVRSGDLTNTSYDASKIITPIKAGKFNFFNFRTHYEDRYNLCS
jgi:hypothetical protein